MAPLEVRWSPFEAALKQKSIGLNKPSVLLNVALTMELLEYNTVVEKLFKSLTLNLTFISEC